MLATTAGIGVATGAIPSSSGRISGCFAKSNGDLRVIDEAKQCRSSEQALSWNRQGPKGDPGGSGALQLVTRRQGAELAGGEIAAVNALCLPGERVVDGGYVTSSGVLVPQDVPLEDGSGWSVRYSNATASARSVATFARCAAT